MYVISIAFITMSECKLTQVNVFHCGQTIESVDRIKPIATQIKLSEMAPNARLAVHKCKWSYVSLQSCLFKVNPSDSVSLQAQSDQSVKCKYPLKVLDLIIIGLQLTEMNKALKAS